jgi:hypothetical protein
MTKRTINAAGFSVATTEKGTEVKFIVSGTAEGRQALWVPIPGNIVFDFTKLPNAMSKEDAARYVAKLDKYSAPHFQAVMAQTFENWEKAQPKPKKEKVAKPVAVKKTAGVKANVPETDPAPKKKTPLEIMKEVQAKQEARKRATEFADSVPQVDPNPTAEVTVEPVSAE